MIGIMLGETKKGKNGGGGGRGEQEKTTGKERRIRDAEDKSEETERRNK